jgi:hypothetical protein
MKLEDSLLTSHVTTLRTTCVHNYTSFGVFTHAECTRTKESQAARQGQSVVYNAPTGPYSSLCPNVLLLK